MKPSWNSLHKICNILTWVLIADCPILLFTSGSLFRPLYIILVCLFEWLSILEVPFSSFGVTEAHCVTSNRLSSELSSCNVSGFFRFFERYFTFLGILISSSVFQALLQFLSSQSTPVTVTEVVFISVKKWSRLLTNRKWRFKVLIIVLLKSQVLWDIVPCWLVDVYWLFEGFYCLRHLNINSQCGITSQKTWFSELQVPFLRDSKRVAACVSRSRNSGPCNISRMFPVAWRKAGISLHFWSSPVLTLAECGCSGTVGRRLFVCGLLLQVPVLLPVARF
jgi:hypothetical protein